MGVSRVNGTSATSVEMFWSECLDRPATRSTQTLRFQAAAILCRKGTGALRKFLEANIQWPSEGSLEDITLQKNVAELIQYWEDEFAGGFDPASMEDDDPARYDECDRLVIGWLADGYMPEGRSLIFELAWPDTLAAITRDAGLYYPEATEKKVEEEELSSSRAERWMIATKPFKAASWVKRTELWESYRAWCTMDGRGDLGNPHEFYEALRSIGCTDAQRKGLGFLAPRSSST